ncbi:hypothetical protein [Nannocystis sp.]|uniref:hypothetical protein n=1 Tax=Nannocystis sp. TaxID=1962667 RepID=UPI0025E3701D|nr:hypothetical protein [Nannocystis sp.]MBK7828901.1 hypothetical protein [Nannocystis sp.]
MTLRILLALAILAPLPACDPELADNADTARLADLDADLDAGLNLDADPIGHPDELAPSCEVACLERSVRRCNGDSMGHCQDTAVIDDVLACLVDECGVTDAELAGPSLSAAARPRSTR